MVRIDVVIGTRPEAIKMAPVVQALREANWASVKVVLTGQHSNLLTDTLRSLDVLSDINLGVMTPGQSLEGLTARLVSVLGELWEEDRPDMILAQGDTTSVMSAALCAFYKRIPFGHVEAGLRSGNMRSPFPEEMNRVMVGRMAEMHFAPTSKAAQALLSEGVPEQNVFITGNTVIDCLKQTAEMLGKVPTLPQQRRTILLTTHRRENFGGAMAGVLSTLRQFIEEREDVDLLFPMHPNPAVRASAREYLGEHGRIKIVEPLDYPAFVNAMLQAYVIVTDSGGVQEEAPFIHKPVLVIREETERPDAIEYGVAELVGTDPARIRDALGRLLDDDESYQSMTSGASPYGDGRAAERIVALLARRFGRFSAMEMPPMFRPAGSKETHQATEAAA